MEEASKTEICTAILYNPHIKSVLIKNEMVDKQLARWIARFRQMENLQKIEMEGFIRIPHEEDKRDIAYMLQTNNTLRELSLRAQHTDVPTVIFGDLAWTCRPQSSRRKRSGEDCQLNNTCFLAMAKTLENHSFLETLDIHEIKNILSNVAANRIAKVIKKSPSLTIVRINIRVSAISAERILVALATKLTLKNVYLGYIPRNQMFSLATAAKLIEATNLSRDFLSKGVQVCEGKLKSWILLPLGEQLPRIIP